MSTLDYKKILDPAPSGEDQYFVAIDAIGKRYWMNHKGLVLDRGRGSYIYPVLIGNVPHLRLQIADQGWKTIAWNKLFLMAFMPLGVALSTYQQLRVHAYETLRPFPHVEDLIWAMPPGGVESIKHPGFFSILGNPNLVVNRQLEFKSNDSGQCLKVTLPEDKGRYPLVSNLKYPNSHPLCTRQVHRLIAFAFMPVPPTRRELYINHKDGNKLNYALSNLEWNTHADNSLHAIQTGLREDCTGVIAINLLTNERLEFFSISECARRFKLKTALIVNAIKYFRKDAFLKIKPWLFLEKGTPIPRYNAEELLESVIPNVAICYRITHPVQGVFYVRGKKRLSNRIDFPNAQKVLDSMPLNYQSFELGEYLIEPLKDYEIPTDVEIDATVQTHGNRPPLPIEVKNLKTGEITRYSSTAEFAKLFGAKFKTIQRRALYNNGIWNGHKIEYLDRLTAIEQVSPVSNDVEKIIP